MLILIIVTAMLVCHMRITIPIRLLRIIAVVAVVVIVHVRIDIRLIVIQINRLQILIVRREMAVVVRREPWVVVRTAKHCPQRRTLYKDRTYYVVVTIDIAITDNLYIETIGTPLSNQRSHILEYRWSQASLNKEHVAIALISLQNTQIIDISIAIKIKVVDHIATGVEQTLELFHRVSLSESCANCLKIEIE
jgi:hypothetical protein